MIFLIICIASYILPHPYDEHKSILTTSKRNLTLIDRVRHHLVNCPTHPLRFAHCDLCICQLSRRWKPSLGVSLMFELLFPGGMSVLNYSFCRISIPWQWIRARSKKTGWKNGKTSGKNCFLPNFFLKVSCLIWWAKLIINPLDGVAKQIVCKSTNSFLEEMILNW